MNCPPVLPREQAVRHAEIRRLALAVGQARQQLRDNRAQLLAIAEDIKPGGGGTAVAPAPSSLLGGKIAGIGLAGLTQFLAVAATAAVTLLVTRPSGLPPGTYKAIPVLVAWFVLGFAFHSLLYGSLGSLASRTEEAQAAAGRSLPCS